MELCFQDFLHRTFYLGTHLPCVWRKIITMTYFWLSEMQYGWRNCLGKSAAFYLPHTLGAHVSCGFYLLLWVQHLQLNEHIRFTMEADPHKSHRICLDSTSSLWHNWKSLRFGQPTHFVSLDVHSQCRN